MVPLVNLHFVTLAAIGYHWLPLVPLAVIGCHWYHWQSENSERISVAIGNFLLVVNNESRSSFSTTPL